MHGEGGLCSNGRGACGDGRGCTMREDSMVHRKKTCNNGGGACGDGSGHMSR